MFFTPSYTTSAVIVPQIVKKKKNVEQTVTRLLAPVLRFDFIQTSS